MLGGQGTGSGAAGEWGIEIMGFDSKKKDLTIKSLVCFIIVTALRVEIASLGGLSFRVLLRPTFILSMLQASRCSRCSSTYVPWCDRYNRHIA